MPKSIAGKNPISRLFNVLLPPLNKFILKMPRKLRPKRITINPEIKFTAPLYSRRKLPMVPVKVPIATKITVNPLTNPNAPNKVFFVHCGKKNWLQPFFNFFFHLTFLLLNIPLHSEQQLPHRLQQLRPAVMPLCGHPQRRTHRGCWCGYSHLQ